jgi:hypothetical protein
MSKTKAPKAKHRQRNKAGAAPKARVQKQRVSNGQKMPGGITGKGFLPGKSGNPGGRKRGAVNLTAQLKSRLTQEDAVAIVARLIGLAKAGDLAAVKLLLDRIDGPQSGPLAIAMAQSAALASNDPGNVHVYLPQKDGAPNEVAFNVGVLAPELPGGDGSPELSAAHLRLLIALCELPDGATIQRKGDAFIPTPPAPAPWPSVPAVLPAPAAPSKPEPKPIEAPLPPQAVKPPAPERPAGRSFSELEIFGTPEQRADEQAEHDAYQPRKPSRGRSLW